MSLIESVANFAVYLAAALALLTVFVAAYVRLTPYHELNLIGAGNLAATLSLLGAVGGFTLPLASAIAHSVSLVDMLTWAVIAMLVQALVFQLVVRLVPAVPQGIPAGTTAHGAFLGGLSLCVGLINAACISY